MRLILIFIASFLFANEKLIIAKFQNLQPYYYQNQIVNLKLKIISAKNGEIKVIDDQNRSYEVQANGNDYLSNIIFQLKDKFPLFSVSLNDNGVILDELNITIKSKIRKLYPPKDFCGVLADKLEISETILASYDNKNNIVYWTITAKNGNLSDFNLSYNQQKLYFLDSNDTYSSYSYSALVPLNQKDFKFSYFNLPTQQYKTIKFHINLQNETVSTQTDIKPMAKSNLYLINLLLVIILVLWIVLYIYRRKIIYIILLLIVVAILVVLNLPKKEIYLQKGREVKVLPFKNSTTFMILQKDVKVKVLLEKNGYKKIEINKHIGWVKDE